MNVLAISKKAGDSMSNLYAPKDYWNLAPKEKAKICNGAGPKGKGWAVPDTIWFLNITEPANIHDYMYHVGKTIKDKDEADRVFLNNMIRIILAQPKWKGLRWVEKSIKWLRLGRAQKYFSAVCLYGGPAFWAGKN